MRVTHLCLACFFPDGYSYQENMLPKFHKLQGHEVSVIASLQTFDKNGNVSYMEKASEYRNEYDIPVIRLDYKKPDKLHKKLKRFYGLKEALEKTRPELLFIHGCQFLDIDIVIDYLKKNPGVTVYVDNHADFSNSATNWLSLNVLHKIIWKRCAQKINPYTKRFYGVLPARVDFLKNVYGLPADKIELLVMGADDESVDAALKPEIKEKIRNQYGISMDDFLIMTGGKIDMAKQQILLLMEAVNRLKNPKVKLIVFGSVIPELKEKIESLCSESTQYIGWINSDDTYDYYASADLAVFPGRHSVFWEQVAGLGIPMLCKEWAGTTHVDMGGNVQFLKEDSLEEIYAMLESITQPEVYQKMKGAADQNREHFLYSGIAKRSIQ